MRRTTVAGLVDIPRLLALLDQIERQPERQAVEYAHALSISRATLTRMISLAERELGIMIDYDRAAQSWVISDWGVLDRQRALMRHRRARKRLSKEVK